MTTAAAIDRLVHHAVILEMTGPSSRNEEALKRGDVTPATTTTTTNQPHDNYPIGAPERRSKSVLPPYSQMHTQAIQVQPGRAEKAQKPANTVAFLQHPNRPITDRPACHAGGRGFKSRPPRSNH